MFKSTETIRTRKVSTRTTVRKDGGVKTSERVLETRVKTRTTKSTNSLFFGDGNAKLKDVFTFSLPSGHTCPFAAACLAKADRVSGKVTDGPHTQFRCFSASQEAVYPSVRDARWRNLEALKGLSVNAMADLIAEQLPLRARKVRVHVAGDFFNQSYFDAWLEVARRRPDVLFYWYSKSLRLWVARLEEVGDGHMPGTVPNFVPTASEGGKDDHLIELHGLRSAVVVFSEQEAVNLGLTIDHDDSHAMHHGESFALILHGAQPAGSAASKAVYALRQGGDYGYGEKADARRKALPMSN
jgi:hypothetical protein